MYDSLTARFSTSMSNTISFLVFFGVFRESDLDTTGIQRQLRAKDLLAVVSGR